MLSPLIGKLIGADSSYQSYKIFCAMLTISILPVLAITVLLSTGSLKASVFYAAAYFIGFGYLSSYTLGFPDPLTIVLLSAAALTRCKVRLFLLICMAGMSHFSLSFFSGLSLITIVLATQEKGSLKIAKTIATGLIFSKLALAAWNLVFKYHLTTRIDWVKEKGLYFFIKQHSDIIHFMLTPGYGFIAICATYIIILIFSGRLIIALAFVASIIIAYGATFITVDGPRIFYVAISAPFSLITLSVADIILSSNILKLSLSRLIKVLPQK